MTVKRTSFPIPRKKKVSGTIAERTKGIKLSELQVTQFALEQAIARVKALEKQCDGLAKLDKEKDFAISRLEMRLKRAEDRLRKTDHE